MNEKILKVRLFDKDGLSIFKEFAVPTKAMKIAEVELIDHKEVDNTLDLVKGNNV